MDALAEIHAVDWRACGLEGFGRPTGYAGRQVRRFSGLWKRSKTREMFVYLLLQPDGGARRERLAEDLFPEGESERVDNRFYVTAHQLKRILRALADEGVIEKRGKTIHQVGIPLHWGFMGETKKGFGPNSLTPYVGDANIETPEYKAFLVDIEPTTGPVA